ncbi:MAG: ACT domain-containing protein [Sphaerochaetaceae bacterium]
MAGEENLEILLKTMTPELKNEEYVFITLTGNYGDYKNLKPIGSFLEKEGLTLIVTKTKADENKLKYEQVFKLITLNVYSSLNAVGLTAAVASKLAEKEISANVVAAFYHDHIFVPLKQANDALEALKTIYKK